MSNGAWAKTCDTCGNRYRWEGSMVPVPPCPDCKRRLDAERAKASQPEKPRGVRIPTAASEPSEEVQEALALCDEIDSLVGEMPERAEDFATSVSERAAGIRATIEERGRVTESQLSALENMKSGLERWLV